MKSAVQNPAAERATRIGLGIFGGCTILFGWAIMLRGWQFFGSAWFPGVGLLFALPVGLVFCIAGLGSVLVSLMDWSPKRRPQ